ncbi:MAG TPA: hypothetical protein VFV42_13130 [Acidimicrobiales bacterium]|nr:hypothetical protein [Acidimicrobiales bacterium]
MSLPAADDLFRPTVVPDPEESSAPASEAPGQTPTDKPRGPSGRVKHDEKMTVYITSAELLDLEHARLTLRRDNALAVDRGRLVREALAIVLADFAENGDDSVLVQRLRQA